MSNGFIVVDDKDWESASQEQRDWMTYNTILSIDARLTKLERKPWVDKVCSFVGGIIGGALAFIGIKVAN